MNCATVYSMPRNNPNERFSVSLPADLAEALREVAGHRFHGNLSAAITQGMREWLAGETGRLRGLAAMADYEAEHGPFSAEVRAKGRAWVADLLGWDVDDPRLADEEDRDRAPASERESA